MAEPLVSTSSVLLPVLISGVGVLVSWRTALSAARAALTGAREQSIETERLRLRHDIVRSRLMQCNDAIEGLKNLLSCREAPELVARIASMEFSSLGSRIDVGLECIVAPEDRSQTAPVGRIFRQRHAACNRVAAACAASVNLTTVGALATEMASLMLSLEAVQRALDWAALRRLEAAAEGPVSPRLHDYDPQLTDVLGRLEKMGD